MFSCTGPVISTTTVAGVPKGSTSLPVASGDGFAIGQVVEIKSTGGMEMSRIAGFGSIVLECPSTFSHPAGATVTVVPGGVFAGCEPGKQTNKKRAFYLFNHLVHHDGRRSPSPQLPKLSSG